MNVHRSRKVKVTLPLNFPHNPLKDPPPNQFWNWTRPLAEGQRPSRCTVHFRKIAIQFSGLVRIFNVIWSILGHGNYWYRISVARQLRDGNFAFKMFATNYIGFELLLNLISICRVLVNFPAKAHAVRHYRWFNEDFFLDYTDYLGKKNYF